MEVIFAFILILILLLVLAGVNLGMQQTRKENHMIQSYMLSMQQFYDTLQTKIQAVRQYRHDLAKHIQTLEQMIHTDDSAEHDATKNYMESLKKRYLTLCEDRVCSDEIVNSIVQLKVKQCQEKKIPFEVSVEDQVYSEIQEMDLTGLLYNLLDNAVEANERIPEGELKGLVFEMRKEKNRVIISLKNRVNPDEKLTFKTRKSIKEEHGIGTKIIAQIIEKYRGSRDMYFDENGKMLVQNITLAGEKAAGEKVEEENQ